MSAYMVNARTRSIIAAYISALSPERIGDLYELAIPNEMRETLKAGGYWDDRWNEASAAGVFNLLTNENRKALIARYGEEEGAEMAVSGDYTPQHIDLKEQSRREWLANLYTVCRCYCYQITEGNYMDNPFYHRFSQWLDKMAHCLAGYVIDEVRPNNDKNYKTWEQF